MALPFLGTELWYILLPFLFVLAIVYGALEFSDVFKNRTVKFIIAVVLGFFAISSAEVLAFIYNVLPYAAVFFVAFFFLGFIRKFFKKEKGEKNDYKLLMICAALVLIFLSSQSEIIGLNIEKDTITLIALGVIVLVFLMAYFMGEEK
jgi:EamA domain-containing membrane protein RarD